MAIIQGQLASTLTTTILTVGTGQKVEVFSIECHSVHDQSQIVQLYFVPPSGGVVGSAALTNEKESFSLSAGGSLTIVSPKAPWVFESENYTIQLKSSVASVLNYWITIAIDGVL